MDDHLSNARDRSISVYDGDTVRANIDLGLGTWVMNEKLRLERINAPELTGDERQAGLVSRDFLRGLVLDKTLIIGTIKDKKGKYGRYIAELWLKDDSGEYFNVNDRMVEDGQAEYHAY